MFNSIGQTFDIYVNRLSVIFITYGAVQDVDVYVCRCSTIDYYMFNGIHISDRLKDIYEIDLDIQTATVTVTSKRAWMQVDVLKL